MANQHMQQNTVHHMASDCGRYVVWHLEVSHFTHFTLAVGVNTISMTNRLLVLRFISDIRLTISKHIQYISKIEVVYSCISA